MFLFWCLVTGCAWGSGLQAATPSTASQTVYPPYTIEVYTSAFCGQCRASKRLLQDHALPFVEFGVLFNGENRREMLRRSYGENALPQIFINGHYIGSRAELESLAESGALSTIAAEQPVLIAVQEPPVRAQLSELAATRSQARSD